MAGAGGGGGAASAAGAGSGGGGGGGAASAAGAGGVGAAAGAAVGASAPSGIACHLWAHLAHFTVRPFVPKASALTLKRAEHEGQLSIMPDGARNFGNL